jgi:hypothetical protein
LRAEVEPDSGALFIAIARCPASMVRIKAGKSSQERRRAVRDQGVDGAGVASLHSLAEDQRRSIPAIDHQSSVIPRPKIGRTPLQAPPESQPV